MIHEPRFSPVENLGSAHDVGDFLCGEDSLDEWVRERARRADERDHARVYVISDLACATRRVVGYYAIAAASILREHAAKQLQRNAPDPLPAVLLARLAVDTRYQGHKQADALVRDALVRAVATADVAGAALLLVHALDERAEAFWRHYGFQPSPVKERMLMMPMKSIRAAVGAGVRRA